MKILLNENRVDDSNNNNAQTIPFKPEPPNGTDSFQMLQSRNRELLRSCTELHELMSANRQNKLHAQQELSKTYRQLTEDAVQHKTPYTESDVLLKIRQRITDLEEEHISLHQRYIRQQSLFRETVRDQRRQLVESINRTRALSSHKRFGLSLVPNIPAAIKENNDTYFCNPADDIQERKSA